MAVRADATGDDVRRATNPTGDHTTCGWFYPTTVAAGTYRALWWFGGTSTGDNSESMYMNGDDLEWWAGDDAAARIASANILAANTWHFIAAVSRGATGSACEMFMGTLTAFATSRGTGTRSTGAALTSARLMVGNDIFTTFGNARCANFMTFDSVLTVNEIRQQQFQGMPIIRPWGWWDLFDDTAGSLADKSGNGRGLTETGTMTVEAGPPIEYGDMPFGWHTAAAAPGGIARPVAFHHLMRTMRKGRFASMG